MAQFFADTFEGVDSTNLEVYNPAWKKNSGATGANIIFAGRARHSTSSTAASYYFNDAPAPSPDYIVRGKFYFGAQSGTGASVGICGRMGTGTQNFYTARFLAGTGLLLLKSVSGTATTLATYPYTIVAETEVQVELHMFGTQLSVYLDGVLVIGPFTDSSITNAGYPGLRTINTVAQINISEMSANDGAVANTGVTATAAWTEQSDAQAIAGQVVPQAVTATASWTEQSEAQTAVGQVAVRVAIAQVEQGETHAAAAQVAVSATIAQVEQGDTHATTGAIAVRATAAWTEQGEVQQAVIAVGAGVMLSASWTEQGETTAIAAQVRAIAAASWTEQPEGFVLAGQVRVTAAASWIEQSDKQIILGMVAQTVAEDIDVYTVPMSRWVVFEGSKRVVAFEGSKRVVRFEGGKRVVKFEGSDNEAGF